MRVITGAAIAGVSFVAGLLIDQSGLIDGYIEQRGARAERLALLEQTIADQEWAEKIMGGGYILHIRHAQRARWRDASAFDVWEARTGVDASTTDWSGAVCLTSQGVEEAKMLGRIFAEAGIPIGEVYSSPICRARQTAQYAFGEDFEIRNQLLARSALRPQQRRDFSVALKEFLVALPIKEGTNTVLTGHGNSISNQQVTVLDQIDFKLGVPRHETGFYVLERDGEQIIGRHRFQSMRSFANAVLDAPPAPSGEN
ncbi:MAG: histidine phosphatase family protein [Pseudomonadota bacterium]